MAGARQLNTRSIGEHPDGRFEIITWTEMSTRHGTDEEADRAA